MAIALLGALARLIVGAVVIVAMLNVIPDDLDQRVLLPTMIALAAMVFYAWFFRRQLRGIYGSRFPTLRAAEALILVAAMFLAVFAMLYVLIGDYDPEAFTEQLDPFTSYYFALTVLATVGFGDITPVTTLARSVTMVQMALDLAFIAVVIKVIGGTARRAVEMKKQQQEASNDSASTA